MKTKLIKTDPNNIDNDLIKIAADIIKSGGLVAMPTETVYGLAANGLDENAVGSIFKAKNRPADNPLILHIDKDYDLYKLVKNIPEKAQLAAKHFWPGPFTMVLERTDIIPHSVSPNLKTVSLRHPAHPVAQALIKASGCPLAAPSANSSGKPSPVTAQHVYDDLNGKIDAIIDGGASRIGVESTVVDFTCNPPNLLRPGGITAEQLKALFEIKIDNAVLNKLSENEQAASPGMKHKHYAPNAPMLLFKCGREELAALIIKDNKKNIGILSFTDDFEYFQKAVPNAKVIRYGRKDSPEEQAQYLFSALRGFNEMQTEKIYAQCPSKDGIGMAVFNRIIRAAEFNLID